MIKEKPKPVLLISLGMPGSGKSYLAQRLSKEFGLVHLRSDEIRKLVFPVPTYSTEEQKRLFGLIDFIAEKLLAAGTSVFYDANFTKRAFRQKWQRLARKYGVAYSVVWVQTPFRVAIKRAANRSFHPVDEAVVSGMLNEIEPPKNEPVIVVNGMVSYSEQKQALVTILAQNLRTKRQ